MPDTKAEMPTEALLPEHIQAMAGYVATRLAEADRATQIARILPSNLNGHGNRGRMSDFRRKAWLSEANDARQQAIGVGEVLDAIEPLGQPWIDAVQNRLR